MLKLDVVALFVTNPPLANSTLSKCHLLFLLLSKTLLYITITVKPFTDVFFFTELVPWTVQSIRCNVLLMAIFF